MLCNVRRLMMLYTTMMMACFFSVSIGFAESKRDQEIRGLSTTVLERLTTAEKAWLKKNPVIRTGGPKAFPPFHFYDSQGRLKGISADYLFTIMEQLGVELEVHANLPWPEVLQQVRDGKIDLIPCAGKTEGREQFLNFSTPYLSFPLVIVTRKKAPFTGGIHDLNGKTVATIRNSSVSEWLIRDGVGSIPLYVGSPLEALQAVTYGTADARIENLAAASYLIEKNGFTNLKVAAPTPYGQYHLYMAVGKDFPELLGIINKAIAAVPPETHQRIRNKWLSVRYEYGLRVQDLVKWVIVVSLIALVIITVFIVSNRKLQAEITERKKAEAENKRLQAHLLQSQKMEAISRLAGGIAHDFNNMLGVILGNTSCGLIDMDEQDPHYQLLMDIQQGARQAQKLTQQLLTFSRGGEPVKQRTNLNKLLQESTELMLRGSNVTCEFDLDDGLFQADVDRGQISQVINNLVINARQAMPDGGIIRIHSTNLVLSSETKSPLAPGPYVQIVVSDEGVGIPEKHMSQIFDPFFTTRQQGSGLGLATTFSIIKRHKGEITVKSSQETGTRFEIRLPAVELVVQMTSAGISAEHAGTGHLLIMDDQAPIVDMATRSLNQMGYEVISASEGSQAVQLFKEAMEAGRPFDAVILDLTVPGGMGGVKAVAEMMAIDPNVKAVASSGYSQDPVMANYQSYGFSAVLPKPYSYRELGDVLKAIFE